MRLLERPNYDLRDERILGEKKPNNQCGSNPFSGLKRLKEQNKEVFNEKKILTKDWRVCPRRAHALWNCVRVIEQRFCAGGVDELSFGLIPIASIVRLVLDT